jgi:hypothetical protein
VVSPIESDWSAQPTEKFGDGAFSGAYLSELDLVLTLGAVIFRTSRDLEAAVQVGEAARILGCAS